MAYTELYELGRGGFARVSLVVNEAGERYAKKTFSPEKNLVDAVGEDHLKRRFIREVKYQKTINHPNVAQIVDAFLGENPPYFIMPLANCTLRDELQQDRTLSGNPNKALFDILAGLEIMHGKGFVHRDLKPANVLRFIQNGETSYAISDFGLMMASQSDSSTLTGTNAQGGTENYSAPELIGGFKRATKAADIYSFGAILHDIFGNGARRVPYTELTVPGAIGQIVSKCTKKLPIRRYESVSSLREELYNVLHTTKVEFKSSKEASLVSLLNSNPILTDGQWDDVFILIDENLENGVSSSNIYSAITEAHINELRQGAPELFSALGHYFSDYVKNGTFDFDYCDVLASKAEIFYGYGELGLKAEIVIALLMMGTKHNRWYVEHKFMKMAGRDIADVLAERIKTEIDVQGIDFISRIRHVERSINVSRTLLHPILLELLGGLNA